MINDFQQNTASLTPAQEAGRKGGRKTAQTHGSDFYARIGSKSGGKFVPGGHRAKDTHLPMVEEETVPASH